MANMYAHLFSVCFLPPPLVLMLAWMNGKRSVSPHTRPIKKKKNISLTTVAAALEFIYNKIKEKNRKIEIKDRSKKKSIRYLRET